MPNFMLTSKSDIFFVCLRQQKEIHYVMNGMETTGQLINVTFHGRDEFFLSITVSGQDLVKPPEFGISTVIL